MNSVRFVLLQHLTLARADDLIPEENDIVQLALKRLPPKEAYDRVFRLRRAFQVCPQTTNFLCPNVLIQLLQCSIAHQLLPASEQTPPEEVSEHPIVTSSVFLIGA